MSTFSDRYDGLEDGISAIDIGGPGMGKSTFLGSVCEVVDPKRVCLLVTKPREKSGWLYRKYGLKAEVFYDSGWNPELGKFKATAWKALIKRIDELTNDEKYDAVLCDSGTDAIFSLENQIVSKYAGEIPEHARQAYYRDLRDKSRDFVNSLVALSISEFTKSPKHVLVAWHSQPPKEAAQIPKSQGGGTKPSADQLALGVEYEGKVLPMIEGSYRRKLAGDFSCVVQATILPAKKHVMNDKTGKREDMPAQYMIQVIGDEDFHAKVADAPPMTEKYLPNSFKALYNEIIRDATTNT